MNDNTLFAGWFDQPDRTSSWISSKLTGQRRMNRRLIRPLVIAAVTVGFVLAGCGISGGGGGAAPDTIQVGGDSGELLSVLRADPRYAQSSAAIALGNDAAGNTVENVTITLEDSQCPAPTAADCAAVINDAVRVILTAPSINNHPRIMVTLRSFAPRQHPDTGKVTPGKPPLADHTLEEWRALLEAPESTAQP